MNDATRNFDLHVIDTTPWASNLRKTITSRLRLGWRPLLRELSVVVAILAFAVAVVALRFAVSVQPVFDSGVAGAVFAVAALIGVAALAGINMPYSDAA
jgi:hypothetical protein